MTSVLAMNALIGQTLFPVLGHVGHRNVNLMVHGNATSNEITLNLSDSSGKFTSTFSQEINHQLGHTCTFQIAQLNPNTTYYYTVSDKTFQSKKYTFKTQKLWQWREDPPNFRVAFGSCTYVNDPAFDRPGKAYGQTTAIFNSILADNPSAMIWGGDNVYFREGDWETSVDMAARYTHTRSEENIQKVLAGIPNYAVWDDHDFGPNDSDGSFQFKNESAAVFRQMWPNQGYANVIGAVYGKTTINDLDFFFLDNRFFRTPKLKNNESQMLSKIQIDWLINALISSKASFKIVVVGSQILNSEAVFETFANHVLERNYLLQQIELNQIKNIVFLSGDRHFSECSILRTKNDIRIIDLTSSPLTSKPYSDVKEINTNRIQNSIVTQQNYALLNVAGPLKARILNMELKDQNGLVLWNQTFEMN